MERIAWDQAFSVGVRSLDEQHRRIIDVINLLVSDPEGGVRSEAISESLGRLTKYAQEHFRAEEELLAEHGYPDLAVQKDEHTEFRKRAVAFCLDASAHRSHVPEEILLFVRNWWVNHILEADMKYRLFFRERGVT